MKNVVINLMVGVAMLAVGWFGGVYYQKKKLPTLPGGGTFDPTKIGNRNGTASGRATGGGLTGEITAKDDTSLTIKLPTGSTKTIYYSSSTKVYKESAAATSDLNIGSTVVVEGAPGNDNNTTAQAIRITK